MTDPARILPAPTILIDHAERLPWAPFVLVKGASWLLPTKRAHLGTGDYAIEGWERYLRLERKARDLYSTLFGRGPNTELGEANQNQDRLRRELLRMRDPAVLEPGAIMGIWVEGTAADLLTRAGVHDGAFYSKEPWEMWNLVLSISSDYGVPVQFVGGPRAAGLMLGTLALRIYQQATDPKAAKKAERRGVDCLLPWIGRQCVACETGAKGAACAYCGRAAREESAA